MVSECKCYNLFPGKCILDPEGRLVVIGAAEGLAVLIDLL